MTNHDDLLKQINETISWGRLEYGDEVDVPRILGIIHQREKSVVRRCLEQVQVMRKRPRAADLSPDPTDTAFADGWGQALQKVIGELKQLGEEQ